MNYNQAVHSTVRVKFVRSAKMAGGFTSLCRRKCGRDYLLKTIDDQDSHHH